MDRGIRRHRVCFTVLSPTLLIINIHNPLPFGSSLTPASNPISFHTHKHKPKSIPSPPPTPIQPVRMADVDHKVLSWAVLELLEYIRKETEDEGRKSHPVYSLSIREVVVSLYRGHTDMPVEIRCKTPSVAGYAIMRTLGAELGEDESEFDVKDATAIEVLRLLRDGQLVLAYSI